uniref:ABC1 atypical kinase-like domain-containing protein n=2 Tax=Brassica campestris TaxID=3711 RepID=M4C7I8_BRACM
MAARALRTKLLLVGSAVCAGSGAAFIASSEDPSRTLKLCTNIPPRLFRNTVTAASIAFDYEYSLSGLAEGSSEKAKVKHEVHLRSAQKLQELCFKNGGIYIKLGQHIGQLDYLVPEEYVHTMRESMLNKCPVSSYEQVCEVFKKEVGETPDKVFAEFDPVPIASASLAQVHVARTHGGEKVAVKVQHAHMTDTAAADTAAVGVIVNTLHRIFPSFDYRWLLDEMSESLPKELDFLVEAKNSEKCLDNFRKMSPHIAEYVYAPTVYWNLSSSKLLTMEFMDGAQVNDVAKIKKLGIQPYEVSKLVSQTFAEMMFKHGFVHCDPHAANLIVRPSGKRNIYGKQKPQLVLLDHGLYKELDFDTRFNYASLWKALVFSDANAIKQHSAKLGAGEKTLIETPWPSSSICPRTLNSRIRLSFTLATSLRLRPSPPLKTSRKPLITPSPMEDIDAVQKPVVVDPPLHNEAPPSTAQRRPVVVAADAAPPAEFHLIQRIQRALVELRELRNQFNAILREIELEVGGGGGGGGEEEGAESSVEDPEDDSDS